MILSFLSFFLFSFGYPLDNIINDKRTKSQKHKRKRKGGEYEGDTKPEHYPKPQDIGALTTNPTVSKLMLDQGK